MPICHFQDIKLGQFANPHCKLHRPNPKTYFLIFRLTITINSTKLWAYFAMSLMDGPKWKAGAENKFHDLFRLL